MVRELLKQIEYNLRRDSTDVKEAYLPIVEYEIHKLVENNNPITELLELETDIALDRAEVLANELMEFLAVNYLTIFDFNKYELIKQRLAKLIIEALIINIINYKTNLDIVELIVEQVFIFLNEGVNTGDRKEDTYRYKNLHKYLLEYYPDLESIINDIKNNNTAINALKIKYNNVILIPIKWYTTTLPVVYNKSTTITSNILKVYAVSNRR